MSLELLKPGDTIALAASARKVDEKDFMPFQCFLENRGYKVITARNLNLAENQLAGSDKERIESFNDLIVNPEVKAIIGIRGGYGTARIVDKLNWDAFAANPKWICGFSDMTVILNHIYSCFSIPSVHSDMAVHYSVSGYSENFDSLLGLLETGVCEYKILSSPEMFTGQAIEGTIIGGNLSVLYSLVGSNSFPSAEGNILFLEDLDEYLYHIDRMCVGLKRAGCFKGLKAVIVGGMTEMHDNAVPFGKTANEIIIDIFAEENIPVFFGFPSGHQVDNKAFFIGVNSKLSGGTNNLVFQQEFFNL